MKLKYKGITFLSIILLGLIIFPNSVKGLTDISYTFDDNVLIDSAISNFDKEFNIRESGYYTEHYNGTYSFENEIDGTSSTNIDFIDLDTSGTNCFIEIESDFNNHSKVISLADENNANDLLVNNNFDTSINFGTLEFWECLNDTSFSIYIRLKNDLNGNTLFRFRNLLGSYAFFDGIWNELVPTYNNTWFHVRLDFECTNGGYNGLNQYETEVYVNGVSFGIFGFENNEPQTDYIQFHTTNAGMGKVYYDAFGYSWSSDIRYNYDFNSDIVGNEPIGWISDNGIGCTSIIKDTLDTQTKILDLYDNSGSTQCEIYKNVEQSLDYNIEMKIAESSVSAGKISEIILLENLNPIVYIMIIANDIYYFDGGPNLIDSDVIVVDTFIEIEISLDDTNNNYDFYIDNILIISDINYNVNTDIGVDSILFTTDTTPSNYHFYIDDIVAFTYNYTIGLNFLPYFNLTGFNEVDKYEFAFDDINSLYPEFSSNPSGWSDIEASNGLTYIHQGIPVDSNDRMVAFIVGDNGDLAGLEKSNFGLTSQFVEIGFAYYIWSETGTEHSFTFIADSIETNQITLLQIDFDGFTLSYHNGSGYTELRDDLAIQEWYWFNLLINYELDIVILDYYIDGIYDETYIYPLTTTGKSGLSEIQFIVQSTADGHGSTSLLDYCSVYDNGVSVSTEYAFAVYGIGQDWNTTSNNLLYMKANGTIHIGIVEGYYTVENSMSTFRSLRNYYNTLDVINGYDSDSYITNATFVFTFLNHYFNVSTFKIDGVLLKEGVNEYNLIFEHSGVDIDESYFYVLNNRLYFKHTSDDTNLEYIQARFNINDVNSTDYSISYRSYIDNNAYGYMRVNYTDTSNLIQFPTILTTTRFLLSQERTVRDFIVLITDKDNNVIIGLTEGYIYNVELLDVLNIPISIITESILNMMIPLIIILIPTLAFAQKFGKQLIVPFFILFSLILTMTSTLPAWLFFTVVFPSIVMILFKSTNDEV